ncbi:MAG: hypothetical protein AAB011_12055 [Candidatus Eisenbacteria bacterium]
MRFGILGAAALVGALSLPADGAAQSAAFVHTATAANQGAYPDRTVLDHTLLNGRSYALPIVTQVWNPSLGDLGSYNPSGILVAYGLDDRWQIVNRNGGAIPLGASFNVLIPRPEGSAAPGVGAAFLHVSSAGDIVDGRTYLSHPGMDGDGGLHPLATHANAYLSASELILGFDETPERWWIRYADDFAVVPGLRFHVCFGYCGTGATGSATIFAHQICSPANISGNTCPSPFLDPRALVFLTVDGGGPFSSALGIWWDPIQLRWELFTEDLAPFPSPTAFHLQATHLKFEDGFELGGTDAWSATVP